SRRQSTVAFCSGRFVHRRAGLERHLRLALGRRTGDRQHRIQHHIPWPVSARHHGIIWIDPVVQVFAHVLQAGCRAGKKGGRSQRHDEQFAAARRCTEKIRRRNKACAALLNRRSPPVDTTDKDTSCPPSFICRAATAADTVSISAHPTSCISTPPIGARSTSSRTCAGSAIPASKPARNLPLTAAAMPISPRSATVSACAAKKTRRPFPGK